MSSNPPVGENSYVLDAESGAELARLIDQDILFTKAMGGLFPGTVDVSTIHHVLDVACGPGGWAQEVAFTHPEIQVTGIDISKNVVQYAQAQAQVQGLHNLTFKVMDATKPLDFPDASFDMVSGRAMVGFMPNSAWSAFIQEAMRILRPGGILRLTEADDMGFSTGAALEKLSQMGVLALERVGKTFAPPGGRNAGLTAKLGYFLREAGFTNIQRQAHVIDFSAGEPAHDSVCRDIVIAFALAEPLLTKTKVANLEEIRMLQQQAQVEMLADDFCGIWYFLSVWGKKPA